MKIKNNVILALANVGGQNITASTISAEHAYKVIKFRRAISKAFEEIVAKEKELIKDCELEIGDGGKLSGKNEDIKRFGEIRQKLYEDESDLGDIKTVPFEAWHEIKKENKSLQNAFIEDSLEGIIWEAPTI